MDLELNSASPPLRVSSLLSGPLRDGHTRRSVGGPRTLLIEATPFSEVVRHDPCFDISRGRPVSLIGEGGARSQRIRPGGRRRHGNRIPTAAGDLDGCCLHSARDGGVGQSEPVEQLQDAHSARHDIGCGTPCSALWAAIRRAGLTASSLPSPRGRPSAAHHIPSPARRLSRTLVLRRSRAARLGGARFDAQHVDVDQARLVSVEL